MMTRKGRSATDADQYGFRWGPLDVTRQAQFREHYSLEVSTDFCSIQIYVSRTGRSLRVFRDGLALANVRRDDD